MIATWQGALDLGETLRDDDEPRSVGREPRSGVEADGVD